MLINGTDLNYDAFMKLLQDGFDGATIGLDTDDTGLVISIHIPVFQNERVNEFTDRARKVLSELREALEDDRTPADGIASIIEAVVDKAHQYAGDNEESYTNSVRIREAIAHYEGLDGLVRAE